MTIKKWWLVFSALLTCTTLVGSLASWPTGIQRSPRSEPTLEMRVHVQKKRYCGISDGLTKLQFTLRIEIKNPTDTTLEVARVGIPEAVFVGATEKQLHAEQYEPGSRMADTLGRPGAIRWHEVNTKLNRDSALSITSGDVWIRVATDKANEEYGARAGKHVMEVFAIVEARDETGSLKRTQVRSQPVSFTVESRPRQEEACQ